MWHDPEPLYGTLCLYHREKREKLSEDFHFRCLPSEFQDVLLHITLIFYSHLLYFYFYQNFNFGIHSSPAPVYLACWMSYICSTKLIICAGGWWIPEEGCIFSGGSFTSSVFVGPA